MLRRQFRESILSGFGEGILANTKNGLLIVEAGDFTVGRKLLNKGEYDYAEIQWLRNYLKSESSNVIVVGSHIGSVLIPISKHCKNVIAFEADVKNYTLLTYNLTLNQCDNVTAYNKAVGEKNGRIRIERNLINTGNTSVATSAHKMGSQYSDIEMVTLDDAIDLATVDLMIMDIEGYEPQALLGASEVLDKTSMLYIEIAPMHLANFHNDPLDEMKLLFSKFKHAYLYGDKIQYFDYEACIAWLNQNMNRPGFLVNLLFSKEKL